MSELRSKLLKQRYSITERQLQGLVSHEHRKTRECLAMKVRKQKAVEEKE